MGLARSKRDSEEGLPPRDVLANPLRVLILSACSRGEIASTAFARRCNVRPENVRYHFSALLKAGYLRISREERARGVMRRYYVANRQAVLVDEEFDEMAVRKRRGVSWAVMWDLLERCKEALDARTIDARAGSHFNWRQFLLDLPGWTDLMNELKRVFESGFEIQAAALTRLKTSGEKRIPTTFALAGFESPAAERPSPEAGASLRRGPSLKVVMGLFERCEAALSAGTIDARADSHISWSPFLLDPQGWSDLMKELERTRERALEIQAESHSRLQAGGGEPIPTTLALVGFESPAAVKPEEAAKIEWPPRF